MNNTLQIKISGLGKNRAKEQDMKTLITPKNIALTLFTFAFLLFTSTAMAVNYTSTQNGDWDDAATWGGGGYPDGYDDTATIASGHTVAITATNNTGTITINSGGILNNTSGITITVKGDITVNGILNLGANTATKIECVSPGEYGIIVNASGTFNAIGTNNASRDCIITSNNPSYNTYIKLLDNSESTLRYCDISELGVGVGGKEGLWAQWIDNSIANEGLTIDSCDIHDGYMGIYIYMGGRYNVIINNNVYGHTQTGLDFFEYQHTSYWNTINNNVCYNNGTYGIYIHASHALNGGNGYFRYSDISNNTCYNNGSAGMYLNSSRSNRGATIYLNTFTNNTLYSNPKGLYIAGSASFYDNTIKDNSYYNNQYGIYQVTFTVDYENSNYGTLGSNTGADIYKTAGTMNFKNCKFDSSVEVFSSVLTSGWILSQKHDQTQGLTKIWGDYQSSTDGIKWNYAEETYFGAGDANVQKIIQLGKTNIVGYNYGTRVYRSGATSVEIKGVAGTPTLIVREAANDKTNVFTVDSVIDAEYYELSYLSADGLNIGINGNILNLDNGIFKNGTAAGSLLTIKTNIYF